MRKNSPLNDAERQLVAKNVPLARFLARLSWNKAPEVLDLEEITSLAYQGLISAAQRWRPYGEENGYSEESIASGQYFSVFARKRITGEILDWQRKEDHVQRSVRSDFKTLMKNGYSGQLHQGVTISELVERTGLTEARIREVVRAVEAIPLSTEHLAEADNADESTEHSAVDSSAVVTSMSELLATEAQKLSGLQQIIIVLKYFQNMEFQNISIELGKTLAEVREEHQNALLVLHSAMVNKIKDVNHV